MNIIQQIKHYLLRKQPITAEHRPPPMADAAVRVDELPAFTLQTAELMRFDPQIRIGLGARNGLLLQNQVEVFGPREDEVAWVRQTWQRLWAAAQHQLLRAKLYGFLPFEVMYRRAVGGPFDGMLEVDQLLERHPRFARPLMKQGRVVGFHFEVNQSKEVRLLAPKALVATYGAEFGNPFGVSLLARAYPAWYEKWAAGGVKRTLRLRMIKDSYIGDIFWYPPDRQVTLPDGRKMSWRDLAQQMLEARTSGGAMTLPMLYDSQGRREMDYTPPRDTGEATGVFTWKHDVDQEIWKALEVPPEVIEASEVGSGYAGRVIPLLVARSAVRFELAELVRCVTRDVLRPVAQLNFGRVPQFEVRVVQEKRWRSGEPRERSQQKANVSQAV